MSSINPIHHQCDLPSSHNNIPVDIDKIVSISRLSHLVGFNVYSREKRIFFLPSQPPDKSLNPIIKSKVKKAKILVFYEKNICNQP